MTKEPKQFQKEIFKPNIKREPFMFLLNLAPELRNADLVTRSSLFICFVGQLRVQCIHYP